MRVQLEMSHHSIRSEGLPSTCKGCFHKAWRLPTMSYREHLLDAPPASRLCTWKLLVGQDCPGTDAMLWLGRSNPVQWPCFSL